MAQLGKGGMAGDTSQLLTVVKDLVRPGVRAREFGACAPAHL